MWVFYLISLPLTIGMVVVTLKYFAGPRVPIYVFITVAYAWFSSLSLIVLVPADIWTTIDGHNNHVISVSWSLSYWSTFFLTWAVIPLLQGYEDAGDFTLTERFKTSVQVNLVYYLILGSVGLVGLILLITMHIDWNGGVIVFAMACSNTFGLVTGAFLLGFGLSEIPQSLWKQADWSFQQKVFSHKIAQMTAKLDEAHQNYSDAIVVAQATSNQMSKRDPLKPYMDIIDGMLAEMFKEDPSFKPQGGRLREHDMDYDADDKSLATLRRQLRLAHENYHRYKSEYMTHVLAALELEDTIKNYNLRDSTGWKYVSSLRGSRSGSVGSILDTFELLWRCILQKQLQRALAVVLGFMSVAVLLAEATLLPSNVNLSLFSFLIKSAGKQELLVQVLAFIPLMYMCICTYYSLFKIGMLMFYSLTPGQTSSVSLLMICSMVARYAPPISYNFLNLICLDQNAKTVFEERMGNIDDVVPFFGKKFNRIYPLLMVIYTILIASDFFDRVISYFGSWMRSRFGRERNDMDGFDSSGVIILQKERSWLQREQRVGEQVRPLARNADNITFDVESGLNEKNDSIAAAGKTKALSKKSKPEANQNSRSKESISSNKSAATREKVSENNTVDVSPPGPSSTWQTMKSGIHNLKTNIQSTKFLPLGKSQQETEGLSHASSSEFLDEIFQRLKRPMDIVVYSDDEDTENSKQVAKR